MNINTQAKKKSHKRKFEGDENQHLHYSKSQKLVRERNRKAKLRKNPAMSIFEAGRERTKRIVKKEYPSINLNKPPSSIASLSNYTPRNKKAEEKSNKNDKDHKSTVYKRTTFRLPIREPSAQNFDMYYYLAPNREPATVTNILELYDETKSRLLEKKKTKASNNNNTKPILPKEPVLKNKENYINMANHHNKTNVLGVSNKLNKASMPFSNKENLSEHPKKIGKENKGILTKSNMNATNILKSSAKTNKLKDGKINLVKTELDDNKENIPPLHHNQNTTVMNLQFVDYPSGNGNVGLTSVTKSTTEKEKKEENKIKLNKIKEEEEKEEKEEEEKEEEKVNTKEDKPTAQRKNKPIIVNTVSDEDLEEFFRVFDDLIPMYRSSTQLQEVIFETSQKEWNEWCYKVEQCEEETNSWLDARIMFYTRRIIEYKKDWTEYWNKKRKKEKEMLELTSDLSSDSLCPNTPSSVSLLSEPMKLLGSSPLPTLLPLTSPSSTFYIPPFQTPEDSATSMLTSSETTPTKSTHGINVSTSNTAFNNIFMGTDDLELTTLSMESNQDLLSNMSLLYDTTTTTTASTTNGQPGYSNMSYDLNSTASYDSLDPLSNATLNSEYNSWLGSNPSSSLSMDDILFNSTTTAATDPNISLLFNSLQNSSNTSGTDGTAAAAAAIPTSLNFLNSLAATPTVTATTTLNPTLPLFDTNYTTPSSSNDQLLLSSSIMMKLPSVSSTASLIDSFANLNADSSKSEEEKEKEKDDEKDEKKEKDEKDNEKTKNSKTFEKTEKSKVETKEKAKTETETEIETKTKTETKIEIEALKKVIKENEWEEVKMNEKEKDIKMDISTSTTTLPTKTIVDQDMTSLLNKDLGFERLFENDLNAQVEQDKTIASTPKIFTDSSFVATTAMSNSVTNVATTATNSLMNTFTEIRAKELFKTEETPKMGIKTVTDTLITPTKPKEMNQTIDFFVDNNTFTTGNNKNHSEFVTPLYIKPSAAMDTLSSIPKSYQEMYNDKMCSLISTLERCVQDKEDFWKVMEEFTSSIITRSSPISTVC